MTEEEFRGFPPRPEVTPLPNIFFSEVLPRLEGQAEIKVVMQVFFLLSRKKGYPRFISYEELVNDPVIAKGFQDIGGDLREILAGALENAAKHGVLLHIPVEVEGKPDVAYFINNEAEKDTIARIREGKLKIPKIAIRYLIDNCTNSFFVFFFRLLKNSIAFFSSSPRSIFTSRIDSLTTSFSIL